MPFDDQAIREGLATNVKAGAGIRVSPYALNTPTAPCAYIIAGPIDYHASMKNGAELTYRVVAVVAYDTSKTVDVEAQQALAGYRAADGFPAYIESDPTLSGACADLEVTEASEPVIYAGGTGAALLACEFTVKVLV